MYIDGSVASDVHKNWCTGLFITHKVISYQYLTPLHQHHIAGRSVAKNQRTIIAHRLS